MEKLLSNNSFFDELAPDYDKMIFFERAVENKKRFFKNFITARMKYAADLGCGSGIDSIALASSGMEVTAFDPSTKMVAITKENVERVKAKVTLNNLSIDSIPEDFNNQFDLVVSLGNTFANIDGEKLTKSLQKCKELLKPEGILLIQVLNYDKILNEKQRIVNVTEGVDKYFIRFYDFIGIEIIFNILIFSKQKPSLHKLISTKLHPHTQNDLNSVLKKLEFGKVEFFSNFERENFNNEDSKDLIVMATKD